MANWKYRLELADEWMQAKDGTISPKDLGALVAKKAHKLPIFSSDEELQDITAQFEELPGAATFDDFDDVLVQLYDWADQAVPPRDPWPLNKMCWVATS